MVTTKVGNRPVNMHIDQTSGQYWFLPVITGWLVVSWSIEKNMVDVKILSISYRCQQIAKRRPQLDR